MKSTFSRKTPDHIWELESSSGGQLIDDAIVTHRIEESDQHVGQNPANQLIDASAVTELVANNDKNSCQKPANAGQTNELARLPESDQVEAWETVIDVAPTDDTGRGPQSC